MKRKINKWLKFTICCVISFFIARGITLFLGIDITSIDIFKHANKKGDFQMTDIYNSAIRNSSNTPISDNVVIVSIDDLERIQAIDVVKNIVALEPNAIGLDFAFVDSFYYREDLLNTVLFNNKIVSATKINYDSLHSCFRRKPMSFYDKEFDDVHTGFVNLDINNSWNVIRTFHPFVYDSNNDTIPSLVLELAKLANPSATQDLLARHNETEIIDFVSYKIEVIPASELNNDEIADKIKNKAVLIGDTAYIADIRLTPLREPMGGIYIHAFALQTILDGTYIKQSPEWLNLLIAIIISIGFVILLQWAKLQKNLDDSLNWLLRIFQFVLMYGLVSLGCSIFAHWHTYVDFTPTISLMLFCSLWFDLGYALRSLIFKK